MHLEHYALIFFSEDNETLKAEFCATLYISGVLFIYLILCQKQNNKFQVILTILYMYIQIYNTHKKHNTTITNQCAHYESSASMSFSETDLATYQPTLNHEEPQH